MKEQVDGGEAEIKCHIRGGQGPTIIIAESHYLRLKYIVLMLYIYCRPIVPEI